MIARTRRRLALSVAVGAAIGAAVLCAPVARADAQGYLNDMSSLGFTHSGGYAGMLRLGYSVCGMLSIPGVDGNDVAREIYVNTGWDVDRADSQMVVIASVAHLCPEYDNRSQALA